MKKIVLLFLAGLLTLGANAQLKMSSRTGSEVVDKTNYYVVAFEDNAYQIFLQDYFESREISVSLGADKHQALATVLQMITWLKSAKKGESNRVSTDEVNYNFVKADGKTLVVSKGDSEYCMAAYEVLVPNLKKHRNFILESVDLPHTVGHITISDLNRIQKKLLK